MGYWTYCFCLVVVFEIFCERCEHRLLVCRTPTLGYELKDFLSLDGMIIWKQSRKYIFSGSRQYAGRWRQYLGARDRNEKNDTGALSNRAHGLFHPRYPCTKNWINTNFLGEDIVQKSANEEEVKIKDGKYRICITVYTR